MAELHSGWCFKNDSGKFVKGWHSDGVHWYFFDKDTNVMKTGWKFDNGAWYYLDTEGHMVTGWLQEGDNWYYLNDSGAMLTGWQQIEGKWYYFNENGTMKTGWFQQEECKWYYLEPDGHMATGWDKIEEKWYYFNESGVMLYNTWYSDDTNWYYLDGTGAMLTGWYTDGTYSYYLDPENGHMVTGTRQIDDKNYTFDEKGHLTGEGPVSSSLVSTNLIDFIKQYEGFFPNHYDDGVGVDTIGYGSTKGWIMQLATCTKEQATQALMEELNAMAVKLKADLDSRGITLKQCEFDALADFAYNCGINGLLYQSTLYKRVCAGVRDESLRANFTAWSYGGGKRMKGLENRREDEYEMFMYGDYHRNHY